MDERARGELAPEGFERAQCALAIELAGGELRIEIGEGRVVADQVEGDLAQVEEHVMIGGAKLAFEIVEELDDVWLAHRSEREGWLFSHHLRGLF